MDNLRGLDRELYQRQLDKFDPERQEEAIAFIQTVSGLTLEHDFQKSLKDGMVLATLMNNILMANGETKLIKIKTSKMPFIQMELIGLYLENLQILGVRSHETFQTVDLYEGKNINSVIDSIFALSRHVHHLGFPLLGPKLATKNERTFTEAQMLSSDIPLLAGFTSKNGNSSGMGSLRQIYNPNLGVGDTTAITKLMGGLQIEKGKGAPLGVSFGGSRQIGGSYALSKRGDAAVLQSDVPIIGESDKVPEPIALVDHDQEKEVPNHDDHFEDLGVLVIDEDFVSGYYEDGCHITPRNKVTVVEE